MRALYFDCFSGISGDMILGALLDLGLDISEIQKELEKLNLNDYHLKVDRVSKQGIMGVQVKVITGEKERPRKLEDLIEITEKSRLEEEVKQKSSAIFNRIGEAESKIHGEPISEICLHELGGIDTIIDIVGAISGINKLKIEKIYASPLHTGKGFIKCAHGNLPIPAPATLELLRDVPIYGGDVDEELVTPTGAAILTTLADGFQSIPLTKVERVGYGAGERDLTIPNLLRLLLGTTEKVGANYNTWGDYEEDTVAIIETNIDNMNPEFYSYLMEKLFLAGAKDVYFFPMYMKKNRPGILLQAIAEQERVQEAVDVILKETTTLGVRIHEVRRKKLKREEAWVNTRYGKVKVKVGKLSGEVRNVSPEYESCRELAQKLGLPLKDIYQESQRAALNETSSF